MDVNKYNLPFEYRYGDLVILPELTHQILKGEIDFAEANLLVDQTVAIVDEAILRIGYGK
jgi:hypothetical protein